MNKKSILIILIIVILAAAIGLANPVFSSEDQVQVGDVNFTLPQGFHEGSSNKLGDVTIANGSVSIYLADNGDKDLKEVIDGYTK